MNRRDILKVIAAALLPIPKPICPEIIKGKDSIGFSCVKPNDKIRGVKTNITCYDDVYYSSEAIEEIRNWGVDYIDDITRREIYSSLMEKQ